MILQIKQLAIIEEGSPDTIVRLTPVTEGPEGSAVLGITNEHENLFIEDRQTYVDRGNPTCEIAVLKPDTADATQLETWVNNQTDVYLCAYTIDGGYFFGDYETALGAVKLVANEQLTGNDLFSIKVQRQTTPGFSPDSGFHQNGFWAGENLLGGYEWADADGDNFADGWDSAGSEFNSTTFSSGQQTLEVDGDSSAFLRDLFFPFKNVELTFSLTVDTFNTIDALNLRLYYFDNTRSQIGSGFTAISSTGRKSVTATTPDDDTLSVVRAGLVLDNSTTGTTVSEVISDPALRIGTGTTYTKF